MENVKKKEKEKKKDGAVKLRGEAVLGLEFLDCLDVSLHRLLLGLLALVSVPRVPLGKAGHVHHARLLC